MEKKAIQENYTKEMSYCYGCGRLNEQGLHIKSYWNGSNSTGYFTPEAHHTALPGYVYGGLLASLIDCHGTGTAAAATYSAENRELSNEPYPRYVTGTLNVRYIKPTPLSVKLLLRGSIKKIEGRRITVVVKIFCGSDLCVEGEVIAFRITDQMI